MTVEKHRNKLFNVEGNDFDPKLTPIRTFVRPLSEEPTGLLTVFEPIRPIIYEFVRMQKQRFWRADEYPIERTKEQFDQLSTEDQQIFKYTLSFLAFLDSVQVSNIGDMQVIYNLPEYKVWGATHQFFEVEHSIAYSNILQGLFKGNPEEIKRIFYLAKDYPELRYRNELIANNYQKLFDLFWEGIKNVSVDEYARTVASVYAGTYAMEAITFYMGFKIIEFYQYKYSVLPQTNKVISEIKADELFHVKVMSEILKQLRELLAEFIGVDVFDEILLTTMQNYAYADIQFYQSILQTNNFGITQKQIEDYIKWLTDVRLKRVGLKPIFGVEQNPFEEIDRLYGYVTSHNNSGKKEAFFETKSTAYIAVQIDENVLNDIEF